MRPLRILMTVDAVGGVWRYAVTVGRALKDAGHLVVLAGLGPQPSVRQREEAEAVGIVDWLDQPLDWMVKTPDALAGVADAIAQAAKRHRVHVIQVNVPSQAAGIETDRPVVAVCHSCVATWWQAVKGTDVEPSWQWQAELTAKGLARADVVLAPSTGHADAVAEVYGEALRPRVIYNASAVAVAAQVAKLPTIFAAARWWDQGKNGGVLDEAARGIGWPVRMAGACAADNGEMFEPNYAKALGSLSADAVAAEMARASIFVAPSIYEPFGLAPLEAARAGCALVLSDIPVFRELWDGAASFFTPEDPADLARVANKIAADEELCVRLARAAQERSLDFLPGRQMAAMEALYGELVEAAAIRECA
jgi:glycosyltransferase involved in cell wall biosynthesis